MLGGGGGAVVVGGGGRGGRPCGTTVLFVGGNSDGLGDGVSRK